MTSFFRERAFLPAHLLGLFISLSCSPAKQPAGESPADASDGGGGQGAGSGGSLTSGGTGGTHDVGGSGAGASASTGGGGSSPSSGPVRVVAANLSSGSGQSYTPGHGIRILQGLNADVILLQEMNFKDDADSDIAEFVSTICGACQYVRGAPTPIPNGIISRYPIVASGEADDPHVSDRGFVWARIDIPGSDDLWAVSAHLLSTGSTDRNKQATALVSFIEGLAPEEALIVLGGDLNTTSRTEPALTTLDTLFDVSGPFPADQDGNENTNAPRNKPYDWILANDTFDSLSTPVVIGAQSFAAGLVVDTRVYEPLADLAPAQLEDSGASGMQHMAVVRDFFIP